MPVVNMTAMWAEKIKVEGSQVDYFDKSTSGLGLRVSSTGKKSWFVMYRIKGDSKKRRLTLEKYPAMTLAEAREKAREIRVRADRGEDPCQEKQEDKKAPSFKWLAEEYLEKYAKVHKKSWQEDQRMLNNRVIPAWGARKAKDIKRRDVIELIEDIAAKGAPVSANRTLTVIRKLYNWAIKRDIVEMNPCHLVDPAAKETARERVLTEDEIRKVWTAIKTDGGRLVEMFKIRFLTAQRGGEVECMHWDDIDLTTGWWTIPAEKAKNGHSHRVPLSDPVMKLLRELNGRTGDQGWVFPSPKEGCGHISNIQKAAQRIQDASGVDFVMHDLRRTAASYMASMGVQRLVISKVLNHAEGGITQVYDRHSYDAEKRDALERWAARLKEVLSNG